MASKDKPKNPPMGKRNINFLNLGNNSAIVKETKEPTKKLRQSALHEIKENTDSIQGNTESQEMKAGTKATKLSSTKQTEEKGNRFEAIKSKLKIVDPLSAVIARDLKKELMDFLMASEEDDLTIKKIIDRAIREYLSRNQSFIPK
jgi:hypothetical protein